MNLATNARDAMPQGGKLVIETAQCGSGRSAGKKVGVQPGLLRDAGGERHRHRHGPGNALALFEPFFTTKEPGKGSGLGLRTVYGTIRQSDGQITVYSQPNCGTIFEIYLPRVTRSSASPCRGSAKGSETILLVDDEEGVRKLVCAILQVEWLRRARGQQRQCRAGGLRKERPQDRHGADRRGDAADERLRAGEAAGRKAPGSKILYMSGYRDNAVGGSTGG